MRCCRADALPSASSHHTKSSQQPPHQEQLRQRSRRPLHGRSLRARQTPHLPANQDAANAAPPPHSKPRRRQHWRLGAGLAHDRRAASCTTAHLRGAAIGRRGRVEDDKLRVGVGQERSGGRETDAVPASTPAATPLLSTRLIPCLPSLPFPKCVTTPCGPRPQALTPPQQAARQTC